MANSRLSHGASRSFAGFVTKRCVLLFLLLTLCIAAQSVSSEAVCKDKGKTIKLKGKVHKFCEWVAEDPEKRCSKIKIKKKKGMKKLRRKKKKKKRVIYNPKKLCGCTCADYNEKPKPPPNLTDDIMPCPTDMPGYSGSLVGINTSRSHGSHWSFQRSCMRDGYEKGRVCSYDWAWRGCRYDSLYCKPDLVCTCANDAQTPGMDLWSCTEHAIQMCEEKPRDGPYYVPEESGKVCLEGETTPMPPPGFPVEEEEDEEPLQIRRRLRQ